MMMGRKERRGRSVVGWWWSRRLGGGRDDGGGGRQKARTFSGVAQHSCLERSKSAHFLHPPIWPTWRWVVHP